MNNRHLYILAGFLAAAGLLLFAYKTLVLGFPLRPEAQASHWNIEARVTFEGKGQPVKLGLFIPRNSRHFAIVNENFISKGYGVSVSGVQDRRKANWSIRKTRGRQTLYYKALIRRLERNLPLMPPAQGDLEGVQPLEGARREASESLFLDIKNKSADTPTLIVELLQRLNAPKPEESVALLLGPNPTDKTKVDLAVQVLALSGIAARSVHGIRLEDERRDAPLVHWLEVFDQERWTAYEPQSASEGIPESYLAWWRGTEPMIEASGAANLAVALTVSRSQEDALLYALEGARLRQPLLVDYSLFSLPLHTQAVYQVILLVPLGVFLLVLLRNVVGFRTFGTFMPVLIALSFRETQLLWGIVLFTALVLAGLMIRLYFEHLKLLVVPRLAAIVVVVIFLMATFSVLTHKLGLERGLSVALFPMVIITMTIERMSIIWDELGPLDAFKQGLGSLVAAVLAYLLMSAEPIGYLLFVFPELLLLLLAGILLIGRYAGYRLTELGRFRALIEGDDRV